MNRLKRVNMKLLLASSFLITASILLLHVNFAGAEGFDGIDTNQAIDIVNLLSGQSATFSTTQTTAFGSHCVGVISILNRQLTASFTASSSGASGVWWIIMIGTGKINWIDIGFGFIFPSGGLNATVTVNPELSLGLAIGSAFVTSPVSAEEPFRYSIRVAGTASPL